MVPIDGTYTVTMTSWFFPDLLRWGEDNEDYTKGVVSGEKYAEQPGCKPEGIFQTGQSYEDNFLLKKPERGGRPDRAAAPMTRHPRGILSRRPPRLEIS